jgi:hypothetical protein
MSFYLPFRRTTKNAKEVKLNSIQEAVSKRLHGEIGEVAYDLKWRLISLLKDFMRWIAVCCHLLLR